MVITVWRMLIIILPVGIRYHNIIRLMKLFNNIILFIINIILFLPGHELNINIVAR